MPMNIGQDNSTPGASGVAPQPSEPTAGIADAPPNRGGIETRLYASDIHAQVERERTRALSAPDSSSDLRDRLVAVRASERLMRERLRQGLPAHCVMVERLELRLREMIAKK